VKNVALLIETSNAYARGLLRGIVSYMRENPNWSIHLAEHGRGDHPPHWLADWKGDGIIARIETPTIARALRRVTMPVVDVSAARLIPSLPWFETDDAAIAQLAYEHLKERGFKRFAYCGDPGSTGPTGAANISSAPWPPTAVRALSLNLPSKPQPTTPAWWMISCAGSGDCKSQSA
jgi:DNA-binding LacI/PurR family transcriptional regulator